MPVSIIVACDPKGVIGKNGILPWRVPEDLKLFRQRTLNHVIIMGRKTWESLPKKPLDGRPNVVISRTIWDMVKDPVEGPHWHGSLERALSAINNNWTGELAEYKHKDIFIIGGAQLYEEALKRNLVQRIIMSQLYENYDGDVLFPRLDSSWYIYSCEKYEKFKVVYMSKSKVFV